MKTKKKKYLMRTTMLLLLMVFTSISAWADDPITGNCGTSVTYSFDGKTLTISGTGAMANYESSDQQPWKDFRNKIESLVIKKGVTGIGNYAFADCEYLGSVTYEAGSQLTSIGNYAFYDCYYRLASVYIPASVTSIGDDAFACCSYLKNVFVCPETPPTLGENVFVECGYNVKFTVRSDNYTTETATGWNELSNVTVGDANGFNKPYIDADGNDAICPYAIPIPESDDAVLNDDYNFYYYNGDLWYYVSDNVNRANSLSFNQDDYFGTINIILCNNATLSVSNISSSANLSIYGQKNDEGKITGSITIESGSGSGIYAGESITINGVTIEISGSSYDSGINSYEDITINGGNITLTGATDNGISTSDGNITITDSNIEITGGGIFASDGEYTEGGTITINGGEIEIDGGGKADGLNSSNGNILINGNVTVKNAYRGIIVQSNIDGKGNITINGGKISVSATASYEDSYGIYSQAGNITINGGEITATGVGAAGINASTDITLGDATITASSYKVDQTSGSFKIADGLVMSEGSKAYSGTLYDGNNTSNGKFEDLEALNTALAGKTLQKLPDYIDLSVTLEWDDNNQSNSRPEAVTVSLKGDGKVVATCELSGSGEWKHTETHLPSLKLGAPIVYTWELEDMPNGYKLTSNTVGTATTLTLTLQQCGDVAWSYNQISKTLTISGTGAMANYESSDQQPWKDFRNKIESLVIKKGVTGIGNYAFADCEYLGSVTYEAGSQLTSIGNYAFYDCYYRLASVYIPASVTSIGDDAFACCSYLKNVFVCPETPPTLGENVFVECGYNVKFTVRSDNYTTETATGWNELSNVTVGDANGFNKPYIDADGNDAICPYAIPIPESDDAVLNDDYNFYYYNGDLWYYVSDNVNRANSLSFNQDDYFGTINIILCNNATLSVSNISSSANLSIYGQKNDEGKITGSITIESGSGSGIYAGESITINGVTIEISGSSYDSGINSYEDITINGGNITLTGATDNGISTSDGNITITDSNIEITGGGIFASDGEYTEGGTITINGGEIEIDGGGKADGLNSSNGNILINGNVTVKNAYRGIIVQSNIDGKGNITINGGKISVSATASYEDSYGIYSQAGNITINGGEITATGVGAAGINASTDITLGDATITASSYKVDQTSGSFKIADGLVMSEGSKAYSGTLYDGNNTSNGKFEDLEALNTALAGKTLQQVPDKIDLTATIVWNDNNNQYNKRPASVTVSLKADGAEVEGASYLLAEDGNDEWNCTVTDLPSLKEGELIDYSWEVTGQLDNYVLTSNTAVGTATTLTLSVTVPLFAANSSNLWMTWCDKNAYTKPEGVTVYTVSGVGDNTVSTAEVSGDVIPAYTPVLLYRSTVGADAVKATFNAVGTAPEGYNSNSGIVETTGSGNTTFLGIPGDDAYAPGDNNNIFAISDLSDTQSYVLRNGNFVAVDEDGGIAPHRCWLNVTKNTTNNAPLLSICTGSETTGFIPVPSPKGEGSGYWYTLDGRKLDKQPTTKGLYIYNGKKHVIK